MVDLYTEQAVEVRSKRHVLGEYPEPVLIPQQRYTSVDFLKLEYERLWPHVWQMACRVEEVKRVGNYVEYTIGDRSVLIVRSDKDTIKGFHNSCLHRGRSLKEGCGSVRELRCGYHAWRWNLDGTIKEVVDPEIFHPEAIRPDNLCLPEVLVGTWGGFVFINFDLSAEPLAEFLAELPAYIDPILPEEMHLKSIRTVVLDCNWKVLLEAFAENYHVQGTHPQALWNSDDTVGDPGPITGRHGALSGFSNRESLAGGGAYYSPRLGEGLDIDPRGTMLEFLLSTQDEGELSVAPEDLDVARAIAVAEDIPDGVDPRALFVTKLLEDFDARGIKRPGTLRAPTFMIFPNIVGPQVFRHWPFFRARPYGMDPDKCIFDFYVLGRFPDGEEPDEIVRITYDLAMTGDPAHDVKTWGLIMAQDLGNVPYVQKGLHSLQTAGVRPSGLQEAAVRHLHTSLDGYLQTERL